MPRKCESQVNFKVFMRLIPILRVQMKKNSQLDQTVNY